MIVKCALELAPGDRQGTVASETLGKVRVKVASAGEILPPCAGEVLPSVVAAGPRSR
jgi:hypothetical protein